MARSKTEDAKDVKAARRALREAKRNGTTLWEMVKAQTKKAKRS